MFLLVFAFAIIMDRFIASIYRWKVLQRIILVNYFPITFSIFCLLITFPQNDPRFTNLNVPKYVPIISDFWIPYLYYIILIIVYGILYFYKRSIFISLKDVKGIKLCHLFSFPLFLFLYTCIVSLTISFNSCFLCFQIYFYYILFSILFPFILLYILAWSLFNF